MQSEVVGDFTGEKIGATFFCGTKPIDAGHNWQSLPALVLCQLDLALEITGYL